MTHEAIELAKPICRKYEGLSLVKYLCPAGYWTIGYGHRCPDNQPEITLLEAEELLEQDLQRAYEELTEKSPGLISEKPGRQAALLDFVFNLGIGQYSKSTLRKAVDIKKWEDVKYQLGKWTHASGQVLPGLVKRRTAEINLI